MGNSPSRANTTSIVPPMCLHVVRTSLIMLTPYLACTESVGPWWKGYTPPGVKIVPFRHDASYRLPQFWFHSCWRCHISKSLSRPSSWSASRCSRSLTRRSSSSCGGQCAGRGMVAPDGWGVCCWCGLVACHTRTMRAAKEMHNESAKSIRISLLIRSSP